MASRVKPLRFKGAAYFRQRILYSTFSGRSIRIDDIRSLDENPGLKDFEASFLRLMDKVTNGCAIKINETGTRLWYKPGVITGGSFLVHECPSSRSVAYMLEPLMCLAPFGKEKLDIRLIGVTNHNLDLSIDTISAVSFPLLRKFGVEDINLKIVRRGCAPLGGGEVEFACGVVKELKAIDLTDPGKVKRVRGVSYTSRISPQTSNRVVESARQLLNNLLPDVYIATDHYKGKGAGKSPGFGLSMVASSTTGVLLSADRAAEPSELPEDLGSAVSKRLCEEIAQGGCVDSVHQTIVLLLMVLCPEDVCRVRFGKLSPHTVETLRLLKQFFGVVFKIRPDDAAQRKRRRQRALKRQREEEEKEARKQAIKDNKKVKKKRKRERQDFERKQAEQRLKDTMEETGQALAAAPVDDEQEEQEEEEDEILSTTVLLSCIGTGYKNFARPTV